MYIQYSGQHENITMLDIMTTSTNYVLKFWGFVSVFYFIGDTDLNQI